MYKLTDNGLVTVIIPTYNHEFYVAKALESVFTQTYANIELIVIDDQSSDKTLPAIGEWASQADVHGRFSRFCLLRNEVNKGAHATINRGIAEAKGEVITILNSDDVFFPKRIEQCINAMKSAQSGFAFSKVVAIDEIDAQMKESQLPPELVQSFYAAHQAQLKYPSLSFGFLVTNLAISTGNMLIHKALIEKIGNFRPLLYIHDWDFALRAILETEPVYIPEPLYGYRLHDTNSFRSLGGVKDIEIDAVTEHFTDLVRYRPVVNKLAPTPQNWPYVFELFVHELWVLPWNDFKREQDRRLGEMSGFRVQGFANNNLNIKQLL